MDEKIADIEEAGLTTLPLDCSVTTEETGNAVIEQAEWTYFEESFVYMMNEHVFVADIRCKE